MATKKKPAVKANSSIKASGSAKKTAASKPVASKGVNKAPAKAADKTVSRSSGTAAKAIVKKTAAPTKGTALTKKSTGSVKQPSAATSSKNIKSKTPAPAKKVIVAKKGTPAQTVKVKSETTVNKKTSKTDTAKTTPAKKSLAAKPTQASSKAGTVKKTATPAQKTPPVVKTAKLPAKKEIVTSKTENVKPAKRESSKSTKTPKQKVIVAPTTRANAKQVAAAPDSNPGSRSAITRSAIREEKKTNIIIAHRRMENKSKKADESKTMINYQPEFTRSILDQPTENQGPVYRYSDEELIEFKELILSRIEAAKKELTYLQGLITRKDEAGTEDTENRYMNMEDGSGAMEREQLAQLASRQIQFINHLEKALMRIENKTYGICRVTGKLIDKARLRAVPHATLSIEAKKTMNK